MDNVLLVNSHFCKRSKISIIKLSLVTYLIILNSNGNYIDVINQKPQFSKKTYKFDSQIEIVQSRLKIFINGIKSLNEKKEFWMDK